MPSAGFKATCLVGLCIAVACAEDAGHESVSAGAGGLAGMNRGGSSGSSSNEGGAMGEAGSGEGGTLDAPGGAGGAFSAQGGAAGSSEGGAGGEATAGAGAGGQAASLLDALDDSVWHGLQSRSGNTRAVEQRFDSQGLRWGEIVNPYGPARFREMKEFTLQDADTIDTTVVDPQDWPANPNAGNTAEYDLLLTPGTPDTLTITGPLGTEVYEAGAWPAPTSGLTATVRSFAAAGAVDDALCASGAGGFDYAAILDFARGGGSEQPLAVDAVAGATLLQWHDGSGQNEFAASDLPSFSQLGGTKLTDQSNFVVRYVGAVQHPGGTLEMRELDDDVEDALWTFIGANVGSTDSADLFLEVHGFIHAELTTDEPSASLAAGDVPIEIILVRCANQITDVDVQIALDGDAYDLVGNAPTSPLIDVSLFPPLW